MDPIAFANILWPEVSFYQEQEDIIYSVKDNDETFVVAGNMLGKDFVAAFIVLWFFLTRSTVRIITTSVDSTQLEGVLWGEIRRFIQTSSHPHDRSVTGVLDSDNGGPLIVNHLHLRKKVKGKPCGISYCVGRVAQKGEGMLGHHAEHTLFVADEASGVDDVSYDKSKTWAKKKLIIGNPYPCNNFFKKGVEGGDITARDYHKEQERSGVYG